MDLTLYLQTTANAAKQILERGFSQPQNRYALTDQLYHDDAWRSAVLQVQFSLSEHLRERFEGTVQGAVPRTFLVPGWWLNLHARVHALQGLVVGVANQSILTVALDHS